jgi:hypothetical protein
MKQVEAEALALGLGLGLGLDWIGWDSTLLVGEAGGAGTGWLRRRGREDNGLAFCQLSRESHYFRWHLQVFVAARGTRVPDKGGFADGAALRCEARTTMALHCEARMWPATLVGDRNICGSRRSGV